MEGKSEKNPLTFSLSGSQALVQWFLEFPKTKGGIVVLVKPVHDQISYRFPEMDQLEPVAVVAQNWMGLAEIQVRGNLLHPVLILP